MDGPRFEQEAANFCTQAHKIIVDGMASVSARFRKGVFPANTVSLRNNSQLSFHFNWSLVNVLETAL